MTRCTDSDSFQPSYSLSSFLTFSLIHSLWETLDVITVCDVHLESYLSFLRIESSDPSDPPNSSKVKSTQAITVLSLFIKQNIALAILTPFSWLTHQSLPSSHLCLFCAKLTHHFFQSFFFSKFMSPRFHVLHHFLKSLTLTVTDVYKLLGITSLFLIFIIVLGNFHIRVKHLCEALSSESLSPLSSWVISFSPFLSVPAAPLFIA